MVLLLLVLVWKCTTTFDLVMTYDVLLNTPQGWVVQYPSTDGNSIVAVEPHDVTYGPRQIGFFSHGSDGHGVYYRSPSLEIDALCTFTCPPAYRKLSSTSQVTCPAGHLKLDDNCRPCVLCGTSM